MTRLECSASDIREIIHELHKANNGIREIISVLDKVVKEKGETWTGDSKQGFMRFYLEWRKGVDLQSSTLEKITEQMQVMIEKYQSSSK